MSDDTLVRSILDQMSDIRKRIPRVYGVERKTLVNELSECKSTYKALMHNITQREYAEAVTPYILRELADTVKNRKLLTQEEIDRIYVAGRQKAQAAQEKLRQKEREIYGGFEAGRSRVMPDPTANRAVANADRGRAT